MPNEAVAYVASQAIRN